LAGKSGEEVETRRERSAIFSDGGGNVGGAIPDASSVEDEPDVVDLIKPMSETKSISWDATRKRKEMV
jgi:hypothetical protein